MRTRIVAALAVTAWLHAQAGCSFVFVRRRPSTIEPGKPVECTESNAAPILDLVTAVPVALGGVVLIANGASLCGNMPPGRCSETATPVGWGLLGASVVWFGSAIYGFYETGRCRDAIGGRETKTEEPSSVTPTGSGWPGTSR